MSNPYDTKEEESNVVEFFLSEDYEDNLETIANEYVEKIKESNRKD